MLMRARIGLNLNLFIEIRKKRSLFPERPVSRSGAFVWFAKKNQIFLEFRTLFKTLFVSSSNLFFGSSCYYICCNFLIFFP